MPHLTPRPDSQAPTYEEDRIPVGMAVTKKRVGRAPVIDSAAARRRAVDTFSNVFGTSVEENTRELTRLRHSQRFSKSPAPAEQPTTHSQGGANSSVVAECLQRLGSPRPQSATPRQGSAIPFTTESTTSDYGRHHRVLNSGGSAPVVPPVVGIARAQQQAASRPQSGAATPSSNAGGMTPRQRMLQQFQGSGLW